MSVDARLDVVIGVALPEEALWATGDLVRACENGHRQKRGAFCVECGRPIETVTDRPATPLYHALSAAFGDDIHEQDGFGLHGVGEYQWNPERYPDGAVRRERLVLGVRIEGGSIDRARLDALFTEAAAGCARFGVAGDVALHVAAWLS